MVTLVVGAAPANVTCAKRQLLFALVNVVASSLTAGVSATTATTCVATCVAPPSVNGEMTC